MMRRWLKSRIGRCLKASKPSAQNAQTEPFLDPPIEQLFRKLVATGPSHPAPLHIKEVTNDAGIALDPSPPGALLPTMSPIRDSAKVVHKPRLLMRRNGALSARLRR